MKLSLSTLALTGVMALMLGVAAQANTVVVGTPGNPNSGDSAPFGWSLVTSFQQIYGSALFSGPITITGLTFYDTQGAANNNFGTPGAINDANYQISLSTTSVSVANLSGNANSNLGADNTVVFNGHLGGKITGDQFTITDSTPFTYDPGAGNLLLDIRKSGIAPEGFTIYLDISAFLNPDLNREYNGVFQPFHYGLVTGFVTPAPAVPEPGTYALIASLGLTGTAFLRRRRAR